MLTIELRACRIDRETAKKLFLLHGHKSVYVCKQCIIIRDIFQQNTKFEPLIQVRVFTRRSVPVFRYGFAKNKQKNFGFAEVKKLFYVLIFVLFWLVFLPLEFGDIFWFFGSLRIWMLRHVFDIPGYPGNLWRIQNGCYCCFCSTSSRQVEREISHKHRSRDVAHVVTCLSTSNRINTVRLCWII